jgi:hypothetical protein
MKLTITLLALLTFCSLASATTINFSAQVANSIAGVGGADLDANDLVEIGTWDGSTFNVLGSGVNDGGFGATGIFANTVGPFASAAGAQIAFRWSEAATGYTGIIYYDIATAGSIADQWTLKGGDGSGSDFNANNVDITDLTVDGNGATLLGNAVLIGVEFGGQNAFGSPSFNLVAVAVPEPSTYAALAGLCALGAVMVRRRRA